MKKAIHVKEYTRKRHGRAKFGGRVRSHNKSGRLSPDDVRSLTEEDDRKIINGLIKVYFKNVERDAYLDWKDLTTSEKNSVKNALRRHDIPLIKLLVARDDLSRKKHKAILLGGRAKSGRAREPKWSRAKTFEMISDSRFDDDIDSRINYLHSKVMSNLSDETKYMVNHSPIRELYWDATEHEPASEQRRIRYNVRINKNNTSWNDLYGAVNSVEPVPYEYV